MTFGATAVGWNRRVPGRDRASRAARARWRRDRRLCIFYIPRRGGHAAAFPPGLGLTSSYGLTYALFGLPALVVGAWLLLTVKSLAMPLIPEVVPIPQGFHHSTPESVQRADRPALRAARRRRGVDRPAHRGKAHQFARHLPWRAARHARRPCRWATPCSPRSGDKGSFVTAHLAVDYAGAAHLDDWIESSVEIQRVGSRLAFANCYLRGGENPHRARERHLRARRQEGLKQPVGREVVLVPGLWMPGVAMRLLAARLARARIHGEHIFATAGAARSKPTSSGWRASRHGYPGPFRRPQPGRTR